LFLKADEGGFLRFAFGGEAYYYRVLPLGLAFLPHTFTVCVAAALASLGLQGIRVLYYINDWLILAQSEFMAVRDVVLSHLRMLGLLLNAKKSPDQGVFSEGKYVLA